MRVSLLDDGDGDDNGEREVELLGRLRSTPSTKLQFKMWLILLVKLIQRGIEKWGATTLYDMSVRKATIPITPGFQSQEGPLALAGASRTRI